MGTKSPFYGYGYTDVNDGSDNYYYFDTPYKPVTQTAQKPTVNPIRPILGGIATLKGINYLTDSGGSAAANISSSALNKAVSALTPGIKASSLATTDTGLVDAGNGVLKFGDVPNLDTFGEEGTAGLGTAGTVLSAAAGAVGGGVVGGLLGHVWGGKSKAQKQRDSERQALKDMNVAHPDAKTGHGAFVTLADGTEYDIGKDGHAKVPNLEGGGSRPAYNTDPTDKATGQAIGWTQPLAVLALGQGQGKGKDDMTGYLANAVQSNAKGDLEKIRQNALSLMRGMGISQGQAIQRLDQLRAAGRITDADYGAFVNGINTLIGHALPANEQPNGGIQVPVITINMPGQPQPVKPPEDKLGKMLTGMSLIQGRDTGGAQSAYTKIIQGMKA